ncbi:ubiquitin carboxyl-terminal hydrolase 12-like protein [Tanacetum coccineum]
MTPAFCSDDTWRQKGWRRVVQRQLPNELPKVELSHQNAELRLLEVFYHKIYLQVQNFGKPFILVIRDYETLAELKVHIQIKLHVPNEEFCKWKFSFVAFGRPTYLQDSDAVATYFQVILTNLSCVCVCDIWGLEHCDITCIQTVIIAPEEEVCNAELLRDIMCL